MPRLLTALCTARTEVTSRIHRCAREETEGTGAQRERTLNPFVAPQTVPRGLLVWASQRTDYDLDFKKNNNNLL